ncbi:MAG: ShlB/FhaC/HecB family hemolysin secretion/activation protein [Gammaproteobacteria bacterium]|nr:ShlB/FhaC/HecB family hemolysin secretion/activation protein [Gammaproteobacteria bacterium]
MYRALVVGSLAGLLAANALAQQVPTPGSVQDPLRQQRPTVPTTDQERPRVSSEQAPVASQVPPGGKAIRIQRFDISGNYSLPPDELSALVAPYEGRELTLLEIYDVADVITRHYRDLGYTVATCTVPAQQISSGTVRLEVIEGRVENVRLEGNRRYRESFLNQELQGLAPGAVITDNLLHRELDGLNQLPGLSARAVIQPGTGYGQSDIVIRASEDPVSGSVRVNNYGRTSIGEWRMEGDIAFNSPLGIGDRLAFSVVQAEGDHLNYYSGRYGFQLPPGMGDGRVITYYSRFDYDVDSTELPPGLQGLNLLGDGENFGVTFSRRFYPTDNGTLNLSLGLDRTVTWQETGSALTREKRDLNLVVLSGSYSMNHARSFTSIGGSFSTNFDNNVRNPLTQVPENNAQTGKFRFDIGHFRSLNDYWALVVRATGVAALDQLVDLEQYRIGGRENVRAYASSELAGDAGYAVSLELRRRLPVVMNLAGQFYLFADSATVFHYDSELLNTPDNESLSGFGAGLDLTLFERIGINVEIARRLGDRLSVDGRDDVRGWFGMSVNF